MKEKEILRFEGPLGSFWLREDSTRPIVMVAGGTGFAPIKGIVEHALDRLGLERDDPGANARRRPGNAGVIERADLA